MTNPPSAKKLKEYAENGIIRMEKQGRSVLYSRAEDVQWEQMADAVDFFSEVAPIGVAGSFLQDKLPDHESAHLLNAYRIDYILSVKAEDVFDTFVQLMSTFQTFEPHAWDVNFRWTTHHLEHVEFDIRVEDHESFIIQRLEREKRCGSVTQVDEHTWRFAADVFDVTEMIPWIRTFISRITRIDFSNPAANNQFKSDLERMYRLYGVSRGESTCSSASCIPPITTRWRGSSPPPSSPAPRKRICSGMCWKTPSPRVS